MTKPPRPWTVLPHGPLEQLDQNLHAVEPVSYPRAFSAASRIPAMAAR